MQSVSQSCKLNIFVNNSTDRKSDREIPFSRVVSERRGKEVVGGINFVGQIGRILSSRHASPSFPPSRDWLVWWLSCCFPEEFLKLPRPTRNSGRTRAVAATAIPGRAGPEAHTAAGRSPSGLGPRILSSFLELPPPPPPLQFPSAFNGAREVVELGQSPWMGIASRSSSV